MARLEVTISEDLKILLEELAAENSQTLSSLAADCLRSGAYLEVEHRNKVEVFRKLVKQRRTSDDPN